MNIAVAGVLGQCPCSGGGGSTGRISDFAILALLVLLIGLWRTVKWTRKTWNAQGATTMRKFGMIGSIAVIVVAMGVIVTTQLSVAEDNTETPTASAKSGGIPKLLDLGSKKCIPCKKMAPILVKLTKEYAGRFDVQFIDVWLKENAQAAKTHKIKLIPTQIFFSEKGKELWRHEGFMDEEAILAKWKELGYDFGGAAVAKVERWKPAKAPARNKDSICYMCDRDIDVKTAVVVKTEKGDVKLCSPHCYFIMYSALTADKTGFDKKVSVTDWASKKLTPATSAVYLRGVDAKGRPSVKAFGDKDAALTERQASGGNIMSYDVLKRKELSHHCGFCDRAVYPEDSALVKAGGVYTWGCCAHCALGVAARTGKDIEVHQSDALTGEIIVIKTRNGSIESIKPETTVAWFGMRKKADGKWGSAGCFHQGNFTSIENLKKWLELNPHETGKLITVRQALAAKMKMTPRQMSKACKIGECSPK